MVSEKDFELAQVSVLGSILLEPKLTGEVLLKLQDQDFISPKCRMVYQAIRGLFAAGETIDPVTVRQRLGGAPEDGWNKYLIEVMELTPTALNVWKYVEIVREQARLCRLRQLGLRLCEAGDLETAQELLGQASAELVERPGVQFVTMEQAMLDFFERHQERHEYFTWPLDKLNNRLFVEGGDMVVIGGYASAGKTALALMMGWHLAANGKRVGFFSLETGNRKLHDRLIAHTMRMNFSKIKRSELGESDYLALTRDTPRLTRPPLELIDASGMTVQDIQAFSLSRRYDAIFIDYLQLIRGAGRERYDVVTETSIGLHQMSQSTGIAVFPLSQLSRAEKGNGSAKAPNMASLRESGQIEQDADVVMLLYNEFPDKPDSRRVLKIAKNKEGEVGQIYLTFDGSTQTFRESVFDGPATKPPKQPTYRQIKLGEVPPEGDPFEKSGQRGL